MPWSIWWEASQNSLSNIPIGFQYSCIFYIFFFQLIHWVNILNLFIHHSFHQWLKVSSQATCFLLDAMTDDWDQLTGYRNPGSCMPPVSSLPWSTVTPPEESIKPRTVSSMPKVMTSTPTQGNPSQAEWDVTIIFLASQLL